jgi:transposase
MKKVKLKCRRCGSIFIAEIFESEEAEKKNIPNSSACCSECGGELEKA